VSISAPFIRRPVATTLLTIAVALAGGIAYFFLPVSPLPQVDFPTIQVSAGLPGASPETMASAVATPLERQFGRIAGVTEMTSSSSLGNTSITLQFDLNRNIDAAGRDVLAAINAARGNLPANLPSNPRYQKVNPADPPIMILAVSSDTYDKGKMYDAASSILEQKLSQVDGVGQVFVGGGALPAVRVDVNPALINNFGMSLEDVRTALESANTNEPKGEIAGKRQTLSLETTDQLFKASEYKPLIVAYRNGAPVRLDAIGTVTDSVENIRTAGITDGKNAVLLIISRQPGANIIETVDRIRDLMPVLQAEIPPAMRLSIVMDRTTTIRASIHDVQWTLLLSIGLVILVVFVFLRNIRATLIPSVAVPISLVGTFGIMYLCDYSLDNLSLMALAVATGFVVDDAIVVIENITRHLEEGMKPMDAAFRGAREISFTVVSMSVSLVAVFIPILLMGGIVGRLFREFAVCLTAAIGVSMLVSLTTTPMMCARLLRHKPASEQSWLYRVSERMFEGLVGMYEWSLKIVLRHSAITLAVTLVTIAVTVALYLIVPKGLFPQQDTGRLSGSIQTDQAASFQSIDSKLREFSQVVGEDPAVSNVVAFAGGSGGNSSARMFVTLTPLEERKLSADEVIARLRKKASRVAGATLTFQANQDVRVGGHSSQAQYQFSLQGDDYTELTVWAPALLQKLKTLPGITDANSDQQNRGLSSDVHIDRDAAARLGVTPSAIDATLYDAFGQRQVSTMYTQLNQYHVVMEAQPQFWQTPEGLKHIYVRSSSGKLVPLNAFASYGTATSSLQVNHQGQFPAITLSFNLRPGVSLSQAIEEIDGAEREMGLPATIHGTFTGTAQAYQEAEKNNIFLVIAALIAVYIVLGILYESWVHPITILSTLPSAGVGALVALILCHTELTLIAMIGIILLIGIVKKNAILMVDFALETERAHGLTPKEAIFKACSLRFRPIIMTTMAALLGALPLAVGGGVGSELRRPLGIAIVGGLIFSQVLTLYTTPVVYLYLDRLRLWIRGGRDAAILPHVSPI
jgi:multidrug efflux pump